MAAAKPKTKPEPEASDDEETPEPPPRRRPRGRRRLLFAMMFLLLCGVGIWFARAMIANSPMRQQILPMLLPDYPAAMACGSASLDWLKPAVLGDVRFKDNASEDLLVIQKVTTERPLWQLLYDRSDAGKLIIDQPAAKILVRSDGSNLEDVVLPWMAAMQSKSGGGSAFSAEAKNGTIEFVDVATDRREMLEKLSLEFAKPANLAEPIAVKLSAGIDAGSAESIRGSLTWRQMPVEDPSQEAELGQLTVDADAVPLYVLSPLMARVAANAQLAGVLTTAANVQWKRMNGEMISIIGGRVEVAHLDVAAPEWIGEDHLQVERLTAGGIVELDSQRVEFKDLRCESELGALGITGGVLLAELSSNETWQQRLERARNQDFQLNGHLDVANLARVLPKTLHLREGTQLTAGRINWEIISKPQAEGRAWTAALKTTRLAALDRGRPIAWEQPILASLSAHESSEGLFIDKLTCQSDFLQLSGSGNLQRATITAQGDLNRLSENLARFVAWDEYQLAGKFAAEINLQQSENNFIDAVGKLQMEKFAAVVPGRRSWREERLTADFTGKGLLQERSLQRIENGKLLLVSGKDRLEVHQTAPWQVGDTTSATTLQFRVQGGLDSWAARTEPWLSLEGWELAGMLDAAGSATIAADRIEIHQTTANMQNLHAWGHGLYLDEQRAKIVTAGVWNRAEQQLLSPKTTWASSSLSMRADNLLVRDGATGPAIAGGISFRGGLDEVLRWTRDPRVPRDYRYAAVASGTARLSQAEGVNRGEWNVTLDNVAVSKLQTGQVVWNDPRITLAGSGSYTAAIDLLDLESLQVASDAFQLKARSRLEQASLQRDIDLSGEIDYDLAKLVEKFRGQLGEGVQVVGRQSRPFALKGPLLALSGPPRGEEFASRSMRLAAAGPPPTMPKIEELTGRAGVGWVSADIYGLHVGEGVLDGQLADGTIQFNPLSLQLGEGRFNLAQKIVLAHQQPQWIIEKGTLIDRVRLSPEICKGWLKYIAPMLADATECEGLFSLDLSSTQFPLASLADGNATGVLRVHNAEISPGPSTFQYLQVAEQVKALLSRRPASSVSTSSDAIITIPEQNVDFQLVGRRVHHKSLQFLVDDVSIRTSGSVGLDGSLDLIAEVPIREDWVKGDKLLASMSGKTMKIPIRGMVDRPQMDQQVFSELARQLAGSAAQSTIQNEIGNQLNKLFGK